MKDTLNLPKTKFSMKANLAQKEPEILKFWEEINLYDALQEQNKDKPKFTFHDGPPYANGPIHLGTSINKTLKDIACKSRLLSGYNVSFIPGWDCHGLPIELNVEQKSGKPNKDIPAKDFRAKCRDYANQQIAIQKKDFKRLGVLADWNNPYKTMDYSFEAGIIRALSEIVKSGHLIKGDKPVYWCPDCNSALAEAEVEYKDKTSTSIDFLFEMETSSVNEIFNTSVDENIKTSFLSWTTTPWTIPGNVALSVNPNLDYSLLEVNKDNFMQCLIICKDLVESVLERCSISNYTILSTKPGSILESAEAKHPYFDRKSTVILGDHVTTEMGTGIVHTAPAHGLEDFHASNKYKLEILNHVGSDGRFLETAIDFSGMNLEEANKKSIEMLEGQSNLLSKDPYQHSFPHCWRHKTSLFFRATPQWFISMTAENLLENSMNSIDSVNWMPDWGKSRITSMMEERPDWCISRQRTWGVPIALYINKKTGELHPDTVSIMQKVADEIEKSGTDIWFEQKLESVNVGDEYEPVMDILDVWFDSGVTHYCVLNEQRGLSQPADLYLEGSDQHRGWFQSSLLTGMTINKLPPFRNVVTHGFVVDSEGKKMSKSLGNVVSPQSIWNQKGADILRAWVASTEFRNEMNFSNEILDRTTDSYRKIRNTIRFLLSNLYDFDENNQQQKINELIELDQFIVAKAIEIQRDIVADYENFDFHLAFQKILNFCTNELGSFYLDIIKDRAYTCHHDGPARKSSQTAMFHLLQMLIRWISPIISFTAEEAWKEFSNDGSSIFEKEWYLLVEPLESDLDGWNDLINLKDEVNKNIEILREEGSIGSSLDAEVHITFSENDFLKFSRFGEELKFLLLVSNVSLSVSDKDLDEPKIDIKVSIDEKCERCWHHVADLSDHEGNKICSRCISNLSFPGEARQMI